MFKREPNSAAPAAPVSPPVINLIEKSGQSAPALAPTAVKDNSPSALRDLLEKNLKWSQIIYEQNRKINNKLFWAAVSNWIRTLCVVVPLILALLYLPAFYEKLKTQYGSWLEGSNTLKNNNAALENITKLLPLGEAEKAQLQKLLK